MGLDLHGIRFLLAARQGGVSFDRVATIGRQELFASPRHVARAFRELGAGLSPSRAHEIVSRSAPYADELWRELGAEEVEVVDASGYEGARIVHDLNEPIPADLKGRFSLVLDGGSLEHVFHASVGMRNLMEMVRVGGHLMLIHPANNYFGHGFYQFSSDFHFAALSPENGYRVDHVIACELFGRGRWFETMSPEVAGRRTHLQNERPVLLLVRAQRISDVPCLAHAPQQHRYRRLWSPSAKRPEGGQETPRERSPSRRRPPWQRLVNDLVKRTLKPSFNPKYFRRVRPAELASRARSAALCGSSSADAQLESRP